MKKILVLHGPNLNLLGMREPEHYGVTSLGELDQSLTTRAESAGLVLEAEQSNSESALIEAIHRAHRQQYSYIIFNPAAYTHTSIALRDALLAVEIPFIEVHISAIHAREAFRQHSYFSDIARGTITGFGTSSYHLALTAIINELT